MRWGQSIQVFILYGKDNSIAEGVMGKLKIVNGNRRGEGHEDDQQEGLNVCGREGSGNNKS